MASHILKVSLAHIHPSVSRLLRVPSEFTLADLHDVLQLGFGWDDCHLHEYRIGEGRYGVPSPDGEIEIIDELTVSLDEVLPGRDTSAEYLYDFGDCWTHHISVKRRETKLPAHRSGSLRKRGSTAPLACLEAKGACPPEDCGGPYGYDEMLKALADPAHERHEELTEWVGGTFDPAHVSLSEINNRLASFV